MLFAHLDILKLDPIATAKATSARDEFLLAATAQNLRKLAKLIPPRSASHPPKPPAPRDTRNPASRRSLTGLPSVEFSSGIRHQRSLASGPKPAVRNDRYGGAKPTSL